MHSKMLEYKRILQIVAEIEKRAAACRDDYLVSHLARYACLLACAALEIGIKQAIESYAQRRAGPQIAKYVGKQLRYMQKPRAEAIRSQLEPYDAAWATQLDQSLDDKGGRVKVRTGRSEGRRGGG